jgi:hypothetical protein
MTRLDDESASFLTVLLPGVSALYQAEAVLNDFAASETAHHEAAHTALSVLCTNLGAFRGHSSKSLSKLGFPSPRTQLADIGWLDALGRRLDEVLRSADDPNLVWPPPDQDPPSLVCDLRTIYDSACRSTRRFRRIDAQTLQTILEPIQSKACSLSSAKWPDSPRQEMLDARQAASVGNRVSKSLAVLVGLIGFLQGPSAVSNFVPDSLALERQSRELLSVVVHEVLDATTDLGRQLSTNPALYSDPSYALDRRPGLDVP